MIYRETRGSQKFKSMCHHDIYPVIHLYSEDEDPEYKPLRMPFKDDLDDFTNSPLDEKEDTVEGEAEGKDFGVWVKSFQCL